MSGHVVSNGRLPPLFPTHAHPSEFWEALGRAVATFGFLEEALGKAIFALTATRNYDASEIEEAYKEWLPKLERALSDALGNLIDSYQSAARKHQDFKVENFDELIDDLRKAAELRNALCHGSWGVPDANGKTIPLYVTRKQLIFSTPLMSHTLNRCSGKLPN